MDVPDALYYLDEGFPPRSLRRYQLKTILQQHDIEVPSSLKRADMVALFQKHVLSRREELIREYKMDHGIADVPTEHNDNGMQDQVLASPSKKRSTTFTTKDATTLEATTPKTKSMPKQVAMADVTVNYQEDDDEEYTESESELEYSEEEYINDADEPVDKAEVAWLLRDTEYANKTSTERAMDTVQNYWGILQPLLQVFYIVIVLLVVGSSAMIIISRNKNGYCNSNHLIQEETPSPIAKFLSLSSSCIPCPDHGVCVDGELTCNGLYKRRRALYNPFGLLPVSDECIQDSAIGRAVARAEKRIKSALAYRQGQHACDYITRFGTDEGLSMVHTKASDIREVVEELYRTQSKWSREQLKQVLDNAFLSLATDPKIHYWEIDGEPYFGTERASFSAYCRVRMFLAEASPRAKQIIVAILAGIPIVSFAVYNHMWQTRVQQQTQAKVSEVITQLKEQLEKHLKDPDNTEPGLAVTQLRVNLTDVNKPGSVEEWRRIAEGVQAHPQIRRSFREVAGEPCEYWELTH
ncbi:Man1-Src1p-C-terminal domain-containing protein [Phascolomyces articulosus]|uniref:Man1-Src1p-C-terminal domain-containing protein n=1 Tax=Phascolomyces articulosus TaxID=60185 RepID=A0AAD5KGZ0_9FUNG|nr:Man1-Src1p-C-terminal domain-containing protein [Phascolomyces articulosus]